MRFIASSTLNRRITPNRGGKKKMKVVLTDDELDALEWGRKFAKWHLPIGTPIIDWRLAPRGYLDSSWLVVLKSKTPFEMRIGREYPTGWKVVLPSKEEFIFQPHTGWQQIHPTT